MSKYSMSDVAMRYTGYCCQDKTPSGHNPKVNDRYSDIYRSASIIANVVILSRFGNDLESVVMSAIMK